MRDRDLVNLMARIASKGLRQTYHRLVDSKRDRSQNLNDDLAQRDWKHSTSWRGARGGVTAASAVYPTGINRVLPAQGFSLSELDDAGVDLDLAESLGLPVDAGRIGAYGPNSQSCAISSVPRGSRCNPAHWHPRVSIIRKLSSR